MGPPKQRWTPEEEASLIAGVEEHGVGKWRAILQDPQFGSTLRYRSNVDLKDKWRNMNLTAITSGSREKGRAASKKSRSTPKNDYHAMAISKVTSDINDKIIDVEPVAALPSEALNTSNQKKPHLRLGNIKMETIKNLNEPMGSHRTTMANCIEEKYWPASDFDQFLSAKLKDLTTSGHLMKVNQNYRRSPKMLLLEDLEQKTSNFSRYDTKTLTRSQVDAELAHMATLTAEEAAAAAARAVAEAEAIMAEAEAAAKEAEAAEANAQVAKAFAEAAFLSLKNKNAIKSAPQA